MLFILAVETLAISIRSNKHVKGIIIKHIKLKISLHADDSTLLLKYIASLRIALSILSLFYFVSGLKINYEKRELLPVGKIHLYFLYHKPFKLLWFHCGVKSLGIKYYNNWQDIVEINLRE